MIHMNLKSNNDAWMIPRDEIDIQTELGRGNFGVVSKGLWKGAIEVAVKELKALDKKDQKNDKDKYEKEKDAFKKEMEIMKKLNHPNLTKMFGICVEKLPFFLVQEFCEKGDLKKHLGNLLFSSFKFFLTDNFFQ